MLQNQAGNLYTLFWTCNQHTINMNLSVFIASSFKITVFLPLATLKRGKLTEGDRDGPMVHHDYPLQYGVLVSGMHCRLHPQRTRLFHFIRNGLPFEGLVGTAVFNKSWIRSCATTCTFWAPVCQGGPNSVSDGVLLISFPVLADAIRSWLTNFDTAHRHDPTNSPSFLRFFPLPGPWGKLSIFTVRICPDSNHNEMTPCALSACNTYVDDDGLDTDYALDEWETFDP